MKYFNITYRQAYDMLYQENFVSSPRQNVLNKYAYYYVKYSPEVDVNGAIRDLHRLYGKIRIPSLSTPEQKRVINDLRLLDERNDTIYKLIKLYNNEKSSNLVQVLKLEYDKNKDTANKYIWYLD